MVAENEHPHTGPHLCMALLKPALDAAERFIAHRTDFIETYVVGVRIDSSPESTDLSIVTIDVMARKGSSAQTHHMNIGVLIHGQTDVMDIAGTSAAITKLKTWGAQQGLHGPEDDMIPDGEDWRRN